MILHFLQRMAELDGRPRTLQSTPETIRGAMFGDRPQVLVLLAEVDDGVVGFASYFRTYSTFLGRPGIWLDDLYVEEAARGRGASGSRTSGASSSTDDMGRSCASTCGSAVSTWTPSRNSPAVDS